MTKVQMIGNVIVIKFVREGKEVIRETFTPSLSCDGYVQVTEAVGGVFEDMKVDGFTDSQQISKEKLMEWMTMCSYFPRRRPRNR